MKFLELLEKMDESEIDKFMRKHMGIDQEEIVPMGLNEKKDEVYNFMEDNADDIMATLDAYLDENPVGPYTDPDDEPDLLDIYEWKEDLDNESIMFPNGRGDD